MDAWTIGYLAVAVVVALAAATVRGVLGGRSPRDKAAQPVERPYEVAHLDGGRPRAVLAALAALRADGLVESSGGRLVRAVGVAGADRDPLERAVHAAATEPVRPRALPSDAGVRAELDVVATSVALLDGASPSAVERWVWLGPATVAVVGFGVAAAGHPVPTVLAAIGSLAVAALLVLRRRQARPADVELARLRRLYSHLAPTMAPSWRTYGAAGAAMGVALWGESALRTAEPTFATAVLAEAPARGGTGWPGQALQTGAGPRGGEWEARTGGLIIGISGDGGGCGGGSGGGGGCGAGGGCGGGG